MKKMFFFLFLIFSMHGTTLWGMQSEPDDLTASNFDPNFIPNTKNLPKIEYPVDFSKGVTLAIDMVKDSLKDTKQSAEQLLRSYLIRKVVTDSQIPSRKGNDYFDAAKKNKLAEQLNTLLNGDGGVINYERIFSFPIISDLLDKQSFDQVAKYAISKNADDIADDTFNRLNDEQAALISLLEQIEKDKEVKKILQKANSIKISDSTKKVRDKIAKRIETQATSISNLQAKVQNLTTENDQLGNQNDHLREENGRLGEQNGCLYKENEHLGEENSRLREENGRLGEQNGRLREQKNRRLNLKNKRLNRINSVLTNQKTLLEQKISRYHTFAKITAGLLIAGGGAFAVHYYQPQLFSWTKVW